MEKAFYKPDNTGLLAEVAELYFKDGLTQNQIADRIGVSRPTIVSYIKQARELGIVDIRISGSAYTGSSLSRDLCEKYGLENVYIARTGELTDTTNKLANEQLRKVARLGAMALSDLLVAGDVLGVSWGETIHYAADEMPRQQIDNLSVCQLVGSMHSDIFQTPEASSIRIANRTGGYCSTLHSPAILSSVELARQLKAEPIIKKQLARFDDLSKVFFSVGNTKNDTMVVASGIASVEEWKAFRKRGAKAVLVGHFLDEEGKNLDGEFNDRLVGIHPDQLKKTPLRMLVAGGIEKLDAVRATLKGNYATHFVTDDTLAEKL